MIFSLKGFFYGREERKELHGFDNFTQTCKMAELFKLGLVASLFCITIHLGRVWITNNSPLPH